MVLSECHLVLAKTFGTGAFDDLLSSQYIVPIVLLAVAGILLMRRPRKPPSTPPAVSAARALTSSLNTQDRIRRDIESLMIELQELSRKISSDIDTRFAKLEVAIRDADRRIAALNRMARDSGQLPPPPEDPNEPDIRHQIVYELADAGKKAIEIARELGKSPGEVELILNLRGRSMGTLSAVAPPESPMEDSALPADTPSLSAPSKSLKTPRAARERKKAEQAE